MQEDKNTVRQHWLKYEYTARSFFVSRVQSPHDTGINTKYVDILVLFLDK